jgi:hypothetical protein
MSLKASNIFDRAFQKMNGNHLTENLISLEVEDLNRLINNVQLIHSDLTYINDII